MAHYAYVDDDNIVTQVIVGKDETDDSQDWEQYYGAVRCSYNTRGGVHVHGGTPFRMNYPGIGWTFDPTFGPDGAFIPPRPFPSWVLDPASALWRPPIPYPQDGRDYAWLEANQTWVELTA